MNHTEIAEVLPGLIDSGVAIEVNGPPGVGKSDLIYQVRDVLSKRDGFEWGLSEMMLANYTAPDLMGYLTPDKMPDGRMVSRFTEPAWMITQDGKHLNDYKRAIVFMDEFGQGESDVKRGAANLLLNRRVGPHQLHPGVAIIAASNRTQDRSGVTKSFDFVINRRVQIELTPDVTAWERWANQHGVEPLFVAFAASNPQIVFEGKVPDKQGPWCTPRSLVMLSKMLRSVYPSGKLPTNGAVIEIASGMIGEAAAQQLIAFVKLGHELPAFDDIVADPDGTKVPLAPDARMLSIYELSARVSTKTAAPVLQYVDRFPKEFAATFAKSTCMRLPELIMTDAFTKWAGKHATLVNMMHAV